MNGGREGGRERERYRKEGREGGREKDIRRKEEREGGVVYI